MPCPLAVRIRNITNVTSQLMLTDSPGAQTDSNTGQKNQKAQLWIEALAKVLFDAYGGQGVWRD